MRGNDPGYKDVLPVQHDDRNLLAAAPYIGKSVLRYVYELATLYFIETRRLSA